MIDFMDKDRIIARDCCSTVLTSLREKTVNPIKLDFMLGLLELLTFLMKSDFFITSGLIISGRYCFYCSVF